MLRNLFRKENFTFVGDRAMLSEEIIKHSNSLGINFIVPLKDSKKVKRLLSSIEKEDLTNLVYDKKQTTITYRLGEYNIQYSKNKSIPQLRAIVVWSKVKEETAERIRSKKIEKKKEKLSKLKEKLNKPYYRKKASIEKKIMKIMANDYVNEGFTVNLEGEDGDLSLNWEVNETAFLELAAKDGFYILGTSRTEEEISTKEIFDLYKRQYVVENSFKNLKSTIRIRPIYVTRFERIIGLMNITMLALGLYSLLEILLKRNDQKITTKRLFELLVGYVLVQFLSEDGNLDMDIGPLTSREQDLIAALNLGNIEKWLLDNIVQKFDLRNKDKESKKR